MKRLLPILVTVAVLLGSAGVDERKDDEKNVKNQITIILD